MCALAPQTRGRGVSRASGAAGGAPREYDPVVTYRMAMGRGPANDYLRTLGLRGPAPPRPAGVARCRRLPGANHHGAGLTLAEVDASLET